MKNFFSQAIATLAHLNVPSLRRGGCMLLMALAAFAAHASPSCDPVPSGIVGWWQAEGNAQDSVRGNNGTLKNGTGFASGEVGNAFSLNGANNYILVNPSAPTNLDVGQASGLTLEEWINPNNVSSEQLLFEYERVLGSYSGYDVGILLAIHNASPSGVLYANLVDTGYVSHVFASPPGILTAGSWQHIAMTYDKTSGEAALYINGSAVTVTNLGTFTPLSSFTNLLLGARTTFGSVGSPTVPFYGKMDEVTLYNRALSSSEIAAIYLAGSSGKCGNSTPPIITAQPVAQTNLIGTTATFAVTATGTPLPTFQWKFNGTNIVSATNSTLTLTNVQLSQSGNYSVLITNLYGSTNSASASLSVYGLRPLITAQPVGETNFAGTTATFNVTATGTLPLAYQWAFDGTNIANATNATLTLTALQTNQSGSYVVSISNQFGSTNSAVAFLTVNPAPACDPEPSGIVGWWQAEGNALDIMDGNNGTLMNGTGFASGEVGNAFNFNGSHNYILVNPSAPANLDVSQGSGLTFEEWINPNNVSSEQLLFEYERVLGSSSGYDVGILLAIHAASPTGVLYANLVDTNYVSHILASPAGILTAGSWQHIAMTYDKTSGAGALYINGNVVTVTNLGTFTPLTSFTNLLLGARTAFGSAANPTAPLSGKMDEVTLYNRALSSNEIVAIYQAGSAGKCFAPAPPFISAQPVGSTNLMGANVSFSLGVSGSPLLTYQWTFNGTNIDSATNAILTLTNVQVSQAGDYAAVITNSVGATNSASATLVVATPPSITQQPQSQSIVSFNSAAFSVAATGTGPLSYQWQKDGTNLVDNGNVTGSTTANLAIESVSLSDAGSYDVVVSSPYAATNSAAAVLTVPETVMFMGTTNAMSGTVITVPIMMNALGVEYAFQLSVSYDPTKLALKDVHLGPAAADGYLQSVTGNGSVGFNISLNNDATFPAGTQEVADVDFQVLPVTNTVTTSLMFGDTPLDRLVSDNSAIFNPLPAIYQDVSLQLSPAEYCADVFPRTNGDHVVSFQDWLEMGRMVAGLDVPTNSDELLRADCAPRNAPDGVLTVADWVQAGRYELGLDPPTLVTQPAAPGIALHAKPNVGQVPNRILQVGTVSAQRGQIVSVPVQLVCVTNESAAGMTITYNTNQLRLLSITAGSALTGGKLNINSNQLGSVGLALALAPNAAFVAGTNQLVLLQFLTSTNVSGTAPVTLQSSVVKLAVADVQADSLGATYVSGAVSLPPPPTVASAVTGGNLQLNWPISNGTFQVQSAPSPQGPWTPMSPPVTTNNGNASVSVTVTNQQQYFRLIGQ